MGLISYEVITPIAYFGNWALIALIVMSKFLIDSCMYLLDVIKVNNLGLFSFQAHLRHTKASSYGGGVVRIPL